MLSSRVCVDASLTLKLVLEEPDSLLARRLWDDWIANEVSVFAPTLWAYEVTSAVRSRVHRGRIPPADEATAFHTLYAMPVRLEYPPELHRRAWELAVHFGRPAAYDSHYLALAEILGCPFWTADERLFRAVQNELDWVHWLGDYRPAQDVP
jgi:predicted nucleic acid-binding protein